jgi:hypothetical protein
VGARLAAAAGLARPKAGLTTLPHEVAEFAEGLSAYTLPAPGSTRVLTDRYCASLAPDSPWTEVARIRLRDAADAAAAVEEVRDLMRRHRKTIASWWVSDRSTPDEVEALLLRAGLRIVEEDYDVAALMLIAAPPPGPADVEARRLATVEERLAASRLAWDAFGTPAEEREDLEAVAAEFELELAADATATYGVWLDGRMAAMATVAFSERGALLSGGCTAPWARGRGAYRALVRARWDDAAARGTPALVVQAGAQSEPILRRLGFEQACRFRRLQDDL